MKKIISATLLILMVLSINIYSLANTSSNDITTESEYYRLNGGTKEDLLQNEKNKIKSDLEMQENLVQPLATYSKTLNITTYQQETSYWCGPANIKQVIQYLTGSSESQSTYASDMGTNSSDGTYVYKMVQELNAKQSKFTYAYYEVSSNDTQTVASYIFSNIQAGKPCIFHSQTKYLYLYNGKSLGHYITGRGYNFSGITTASVGETETQSTASTNAISGTVYYTDPYSNDYGRGSTLGNHSDSLTNICNSMSGRYLIK